MAAGRRTRGEAGRDGRERRRKKSRENRFGRAETGAWQRAVDAPARRGAREGHNVILAGRRAGGAREGRVAHALVGLASVDVEVVADLLEDGVEHLELAALVRGAELGHRDGFDGAGGRVALLVRDDVVLELAGVARARARAPLAVEGVRRRRARGGVDLRGGATAALAEANGDARGEGGGGRGEHRGGAAREGRGASRARAGRDICASANAPVPAEWGERNPGPIRSSARIGGRARRARRATRGRTFSCGRGRGGACASTRVTARPTDRAISRRSLFGALFAIRARRTRFQNRSFRPKSHLLIFSADVLFPFLHTRRDDPVPSAALVRSPRVYTRTTRRSHSRASSHRSRPESNPRRPASRRTPSPLGRAPLLTAPAPPSRVRAHVPVRLEHAPAELEHRAGAHLHPPRRARDRRAVHGQHRPRGFALDRLERARLERRPGSFVERSFRRGGGGGGGGDCFLLRRRRRRRRDGPVRGGEPGPLDGDEEEEESNGERSDARVELLRPPGGRPRDVGGPAARGEG